MPKTKIPTLGAVAAEQDDEKRKTKGASLLARGLAMLGLATPDAKMTKKTLTTKRVEMEESDDEEEESLPMSTEKSSGAESSMASSKEEEEESDAASSAEEEEEEEEEAVKGAKKMEEEEEASAIARGWKAAEKAYAKATKGVDAYGVKGPKGLLRAAEKATGAKGHTATLTALHGLRSKAATADAEVIQRLAKVEARATKIEVTSRAERIEALVKDAKAEGRASSKALRDQLRAYGAANGSRKLAALIATLPKVPTNAKAPKIDINGNVPGAPAPDEQAIMQAMFGDLPKEQREAAIAEFKTKMRMNGAGKAEA